MTAGSLEFRLLGHLEAIRDGEILHIGGPKHRTLLAMLLLHANDPVAVDALAEALWPERPPARFESTLQVYVSQLRGELGRDSIVRRGPGYVLAVEPERVDLHRFERLAGEGRAALTSGAPERAGALLGDALALWRGPALADFRYDAFALPHAERLDELRLAAVEARVEVDLALGRTAELVPELRVLVAEHPLRERLRGHLMLTLYRSGRQAEALEAYQVAREALVEELGIEPSPELKDLHRRILGQDEGLAAPRSVRAPTPVRPPAPASTLVGRERELAAVAELLEAGSVRLVTLTGAGGTGKTRLALAVAARIGDRFADGAIWVPLDAVRDPTLVLPAIAQALRIEDDAAAYLADREALLALDNLEQVLDAAPELGELLASCPRVSILATSREALRLHDEHEFAVPPLSEPDAVALFAERATAGGGADDGAVAEICRRLDCLPLALELAAARTKVLTPEQILARLDRRFSLLTAGPRDAPGRQQTLRATVDWSHELLGEEERQLFARLAVFAGGCTLDAAERVADADLDTLQALVERSLLRREGERFRMLETIREYAAERLAESADVRLRRRHAEYYLALADAGAEAELGNLRSALTWALDAGATSLALGLAVAFARASDGVGVVAEAQLQLDRVLAVADAAPADLRVRVLSEAAAIALRAGDWERGAQLGAEQVAYGRDHGEPRPVVSGLCKLVRGALEEGDEARAADLADRAVEIASAAADEPALLSALTMKGLVELTRGRPGDAVPLFDRCVELAPRGGRRRDTVATAIFNAALARHLAGDDDGAAAGLEECLELYRGFDHPEGLGYCLVLQAALAASGGRHREAAGLLGTADALLARAGAALERVERELRDSTVAAVAEALGAAEAARLSGDAAAAAGAAG